MAQSFSRLLLARRRHLSSTIAAATATTFLATCIYPRDGDGSVNDDVDSVGPSDGPLRRRSFEPSCQQYLTSSAISLFAYPQNSRAFCEAPHPSLHPYVTYKPSDPAEPVADPAGGVDVATSDGRKVHVQGGMWGADQEGLVGRGNTMISQFHHSIY